MRLGVFMLVFHFTLAKSFNFLTNCSEKFQNAGIIRNSGIIGGWEVLRYVLKEASCSFFIKKI